jgi:hypothetical protein
MSGNSARKGAAVLIQRYAYASLMKLLASCTDGASSLGSCHVRPGAFTKYPYEARWICACRILGQITHATSCPESINLPLGRNVKQKSSRRNAGGAVSLTTAPLFPSASTMDDENSRFISELPFSFGHELAMMIIPNLVVGGGVMMISLITGILCGHSHVYCHGAPFPES